MSSDISEKLEHWALNLMKVPSPLDGQHVDWNRVCAPPLRSTWLHVVEHCYPPQLVNLVRGNLHRNRGKPPAAGTRPVSGNLSKLSKQLVQLRCQIREERRKGQIIVKDACECPLRQSSRVLKERKHHSEEQALKTLLLEKFSTTQEREAKEMGSAAQRLQETIDLFSKNWQSVSDDLLQLNCENSLERIHALFLRFLLHSLLPDDDAHREIPDRAELERQVAALVGKFPCGAIARSLQRIAARQTIALREKTLSHDIQRELSALRCSFDDGKVRDLEAENGDSASHQLEDTIEQEQLQFIQSCSEARNRDLESVANMAEFESVMRKLKMVLRERLAEPVAQLAYQSIKTKIGRSVVEVNSGQYESMLASLHQCVREERHSRAAVEKERDLLKRFHGEVAARQKLIVAISGQNGRATAKIGEYMTRNETFAEQHLVLVWAELAAAMRPLHDSVSLQTDQTRSLDVMRMATVQMAGSPLALSELGIHRFSLGDEVARVQDMMRASAFPLEKSPALLLPFFVERQVVGHLLRLLQSGTIPSEAVHVFRRRFRDLVAQSRQTDAALCDQMSAELTQRTDLADKAILRCDKLRHLISEWFHQPIHEHLPESATVQGKLFEEWLNRWHQACALRHAKVAADAEPTHLR